MNKWMCTIASVLGMAVMTACSPTGSLTVPTSSSSPSTTTMSPYASTPTPSASSGATSGRGVTDCLAYTDHVYEVCVAYVWNDAHASLQPYYKYVHSDSSLSFLKDRLALKYQGQALQVVQQRTANWPAGTNTVDGPEIAILSARSSLACDKAVLTTRENWTVRMSNGHVLYQENGQFHTIVLRRTPDERFRYGNSVLHQWVVDAIYDGEQNLPVC